MPSVYDLSFGVSLTFRTISGVFAIPTELHTPPGAHDAGVFQRDACHDCQVIRRRYDMKQELHYSLRVLVQDPW